MKSYYYFLPFFFLVGTLLLSACQHEETFVPKPYGFFRIELPEHAYQKLEGDYPYTFEYSKFAKVVPNRHERAEKYWIALDYDTTTIAEIHITYKAINGDEKLFREYVNDAHKLTFNEITTARSTAIDQLIETRNGNGVVFTFSEGEIPTVFNYWISDSTHHFFRAAMYVPTSTENDSLAPVLKYTKDDMMHMLETFEWKK